MAKKGLFENLKGMTDKSYLLDSSLSMDGEIAGPEAVKDSVLDIELLIPFVNHPFHVDTEDENFLQLVDSIKENGIIEPVLVRPKGDKYEIISGHRRVEAGRKAGLTEIPVVIREFDDYEATIIMVHSNFYREKILISEKAKAYRMCMDAEKHQGKKGIDTAEIIGGEQESKRQVYRYIRLSYLSDQLLAYLDDGKMAMNVGGELSYLSEDSQQYLIQAMDEYGIIPTLEQAKSLREKEKISGDFLPYAEIVTELTSVLKKKTTGNNISFKKKELQEYFDDETPVETMSNVIMILLEQYRDGKLREVLDEEWKYLAKEYKENPTEEIRLRMNEIRNIIK